MTRFVPDPNPNHTRGLALWKRADALRAQGYWLKPGGALTQRLNQLIDPADFNIPKKPQCQVELIAASPAHAIAIQGALQAGLSLFDFTSDRLRNWN